MPDDRPHFDHAGPDYYDGGININLDYNSKYNTWRVPYDGCYDEYDFAPSRATTHELPSVSASCDDDARPDGYDPSTGDHDLTGPYRHLSDNVRDDHDGP